MGTLRYALSGTYSSGSGIYTKPKPLREFDLKVGEKISVREKAGPYELSEDPEKTKFVTHFYTITAIYPFVFTVVSRKGIPYSFQKKEYQLGFIKRVTE